ncbi:unnamed protein product [Urochloa humidicola]
MGRPSMEALAMAGADWARYDVDGEEEEQGAPPPAHLRAFEAFLEKVVPADMALAFGRDEAACARRGRRGHREDVEEKLKLWAKAVAREAKRGVLAPAKSQQAASATSPPPRLIAPARDVPVVVLARPTGEPNSIARGDSTKEKGEQTLPGQAQVAGKLALSPKAMLAPSPRSGRRGGEHCQSNRPIPKLDIKCIYGVY